MHTRQKHVAQTIYQKSDLVRKSDKKAIADLLLEPTSLAAREAMLLMPPPDYKKEEEEDVDAKIELNGKAIPSNPKFFTFSVDDIKTSKPESQIKLVLNQYTKEGQ